MLTKECKYLQIELDTIVKEKQNLLNRISYLLKQIHQYECKLAEQKPFDEQYTLLQKQYQIRTDDLQDTIDEICLLSELPVSIIIVGVGNADFSAMEKLDADVTPLKHSNGKKYTPSKI